MKIFSPYFPMIFGILFIIIGFINWYKNGVIEIGLFLFGIVPILISVLLLVKGEKTTIVIKSSKSKTKKSKTNLQKYEKEIEEYDQFINNVYICCRRDVIGNQIGFLCVHKETKELYSFSAKVVGHRGIFDVYCFAQKPEKIETYKQLLLSLGIQAKEFYKDLGELNWKDYFNFIFIPAAQDGETINKQLLSSVEGDARNAVFAVHDIVLKSPAERKAFLSASYQNLSLIKKNIDSLDMGGMFASNKRFAYRAIEIIEGNNTDKCFCRLLIDEFGPSANGLSKKGFLLISEDEKIDDYSVRGIIECPICHKRYSIVEEYTGWHIPTRIHCSEITNK